MYNFVDKEGARVTLRPEMTPTLARMVLNLMCAETGNMSALLPLKWYSIPQCWRFETTQRGRKREHYQFNCDIVGVDNVTGDVEILALMVDFFRSVGLTEKQIKIKVNSRKVLQAVMIRLSRCFALQHGGGRGKHDGSTDFVALSPQYFLHHTDSSPRSSEKSFCDCFLPESILIWNDRLQS